MAAAAVREGKTMAHYCAVAERGQGTIGWISFPGRDGITSAADDAEIVSQALDALGASHSLHAMR